MNTECQVEKVDGQVKHELAYAENIVARLQEELDELETLLYDVLTVAPPPLEAPKSAEGEHALVPLAERIKSYSETLRAIEIQISALRNRLELR